MASAHRNPPPSKFRRDSVHLVGDLLPICDIAGVLIAAYLAALAYPPGAPGAPPLDQAWQAAIAAALLAPLMLCDRAFVAYASGGRAMAFARCYALRFLMFSGAVLLIGQTSQTLSSLPSAWLLCWFSGSLMLTAATRLLLVISLRRLERRGVLTEAIAIVGSGPVADRLIQHLQKTRPGSVEMVGIFDDRVDGDPAGMHPPTASVDALLELGKSREIDWILLTCSPSAGEELDAMVHRLKSLSVPIGLCPQDLGLETPCDVIRYVGDGLPVTLQMDRKAQAWTPLLAGLRTVLPPWIITLITLPLELLRPLLMEIRQRVERRTTAPRTAPRERLVCALDDHGLEHFTEVAARFGQEHYGYVVTPNADHLIRLHREPSFRALYAEAAYVLLDSRFIAGLLRLTRNQHLPVCTGSDLTAKLLGEVVRPDDDLLLIGGSPEQAAFLRARYGLERLAHFDPPMGFIRDPAAVEACLGFIESNSPFRYCFLAVGAPQQEAIAQRLKARGKARGLALCIGGSINFLTGGERRAPRWMRKAGMEWSFRLLQDPGRMARRYLLQGPGLFRLLGQTDLVLRSPALVGEGDPLAAPPGRFTARHLPPLAEAPLSGRVAARRRGQSRA